MRDYPEWLINSIPTIQPSLESTTSVSSDDTTDDTSLIFLDHTNPKIWVSVIAIGHYSCEITEPRYNFYNNFAEITYIFKRYYSYK